MACRQINEADALGILMIQYGSRLGSEKSLFKQLRNSLNQVIRKDTSYRSYTQWKKNLVLYYVTQDKIIWSTFTLILITGYI